MKLEDLLRMAFTDGRRYGANNTDVNFNDHLNSVEYKEAIKLFENTTEFKRGDILTIAYLRTKHQNLNGIELDSLLRFAKMKTIKYVECYGDGSIIYPQWKEAMQNARNNS